MLKVSLLPESYKKQIVGSKKKDAIKRVALIVLVMVLAMLVVVVGTRQLVYSKLHEVEALNQKTVDMFPQLNEYEALYAEVVVQRELLDSISAKEPYAQNFVVSLGNIVMPNVWLNKVLAEDWFYTKQCTIEGKCLSYDELSAYIDKISGIEDVLSVTINTFEVTT